MRQTVRGALCVGLSSLIVLCAASVASGQAQPDNGVEAAVKQAIESSPEVQSRWYDFLSAGHDVDVARGQYRPTVDIVSRVTDESRNYGANEEFSNTTAELTLTQMLYDGFQTRSEVNRLSHSQLVRYYELLEEVQSTALETITAYEDVRRQRELVDIAQEIYDEHLDVRTQVQESSSAGVARGVDLEQLNARVALTRSTFVDERSNLHDVTARYLRLVGSSPDDSLEPVTIDASQIPGDLNSAMRLALKNNPTFRAARRDIEASIATKNRERAAFRPQLSLNASYGTDSHNDFGARERQTEARIGLELRFNLYNGGSDQAAQAQAAQDLNVAKSRRDTACVNIRQRLQIALNDLEQLDDQVDTLNDYRIAADRVRVAYQNQFQIDQRTLLDVLDSVNEYFQASRSYRNARADHRIAKARVLAASGTLLTALDVRRDGIPTLADLGAAPLDVAPEAACPSVDRTEAPPTTTGGGLTR